MSFEWSLKLLASKPYPSSILSPLLFGDFDKFFYILANFIEEIPLAAPAPKYFYKLDC
jgi:hypothetical protein